MDETITLEVCVDNAAGLAAALAGGADRIELCSALDTGGLTPSFGLLRAGIGQPEVPVVAMIRPRGGDFCFDEAEIQLMLDDIDASRRRRLARRGTRCLSAGRPARSSHAGTAGAPRRRPWLALHAAPGHRSMSGPGTGHQFWR